MDWEPNGFNGAVEIGHWKTGQLGNSQSTKKIWVDSHFHYTCKNNVYTKYKHYILIFDIYIYLYQCENNVNCNVVWKFVNMTSTELLGMMDLFVAQKHRWRRHSFFFALRSMWLFFSQFHHDLKQLWLRRNQHGLRTWKLGREKKKQKKTSFIVSFIIPMPIYLILFAQWWIII